MYLVISEAQSGEMSKVTDLRGKVKQLVVLEVKLGQLPTF